MHPKVQDILKRAGDTGGERVILKDGATLSEEGEVLEYGHADSAFVLTGPGGSLPADLAKEIGVKGKAVEPAKAAGVGDVSDVPDTPERTPVDKAGKRGIINQKEEPAKK